MTHDREQADAELTASLLAGRARDLARPAIDRGASSDTSVLTFTLGGESYALAAEFVIAVLRLEKITPLPGAVAPVYGITPFRGSVLTLLDLRPILGVPSASLADRGRVVVVGLDNEPLMGLLADAVLDVSPLDIDSLTPVDALRSAGGLVRGLTSNATVVLDANRLIEQQDDTFEVHDNPVRKRNT